MSREDKGHNKGENWGRAVGALRGPKMELRNCRSCFSFAAEGIIVKENSGWAQMGIE